MAVIGLPKARVPAGLYKAAGVQPPAARRKGFTPFTQPKPPPGTYDPALDSTERGAKRGYLQLQQDAERDQQRENADRAVGLESIGREQTAFDTGQKNTLADLVLGRDRGAQDFAAGTATRNRQYGELGQAQTQGATAQGTGDASTIQASAEARGINQARDQGAAQQIFDRFLADNATAQKRTTDAQTAGDTGYDQQGAALNLKYGRSGNDRVTDLTRAGDELSFFGQDTGTQRAFQASQTGAYRPPAAPKNEFKDAKGAYRLIVEGSGAKKKRFKLRPNGQREPA